MMPDSLPQSPFFLDSVHHLKCFKKHNFFKAGSAPFSDNKVPNLVDPLDSVLLSQWDLSKRLGGGRRLGQ
jgi:hypothetical protein